MDFQQIQKDRLKVSVIYLQTVKARKAELLSTSMSLVSDLIIKYEENLEKNPSINFASMRMAIKYFKFVYSQIEKRSNQVQRANILRNARLLSTKDYERKIDDLIRIRTLISLQASQVKMSHKKSEAMELLEKMLADGYNPLQDKETREKAIEEIKKRNQIDETDLLAKLQEFDKLKSSDAGANADDFAAALLKDEKDKDKKE